MDENDEKKRYPARAAAYVCVYPMLLEIAKQHGYSLAIHGSMHRDMDLVAIPWTEEATDAHTLIKAFKEATDTVITSKEWDRLVPEFDPSKKPHGRVAYSLHCTEEGMFGAYFDISVMPRVPKVEQP